MKFKFDWENITIGVLVLVIIGMVIYYFVKNGKKSYFFDASCYQTCLNYLGSAEDPEGTCALSCSNDTSDDSNNNGSDSDDDGGSSDGGGSSGGGSGGGGRQRPPHHRPPHHRRPPHHHRQPPHPHPIQRRR